MYIQREEVYEVEKYLLGIEEKVSRLMEEDIKNRKTPLMSFLAYASCVSLDVDPNKFFSERPHLLMATGEFDEYRDLGACSIEGVPYRFWTDPNAGEFVPYIPQTPGIWDKAKTKYVQSAFRQATGTWWLLTQVPWSSKHFFRLDPQLRPGVFTYPAEAIDISFEDFLESLYRTADRYLEGDRVIWPCSRQRWTRNAQAIEFGALGTARDLIRQLRAENISFADLSWQQLEEVVAEILRSRGMEVAIQRQRPQGGRDLIARGELIPGYDPVTIAVEVKHRAVVDRREVNTALWQNKGFSALVFVTSGRFTAGVLREKALPENHLRLVLKDGAALGKMIRDYSLEKNSP